MVSKFEIALKECNESEYWLELLCDTGCISAEVFSSFKTNCINIRRMLVASVKKLKGDKKFSDCPTDVGGVPLGK